MEQHKILSKLCYYDERNPEGHHSYVNKDDSNHLLKHDNCMCDNCFYGRTELAEEILRQQKSLITTVTYKYVK